MTRKQEHEQMIALLRESISATQSIAAVIGELRGDLRAAMPHLDILAGAVADLGNVIGSDPERALRHMKLIRGMAKLSSDQVIKRAVKRLRKE